MLDDLAPAVSAEPGESDSYEGYKRAIAAALELTPDSIVVLSLSADRAMDVVTDLCLSGRFELVGLSLRGDAAIRRAPSA